jgi:hypothetical protein
LAEAVGDPGGPGDDPATLGRAQLEANSDKDLDELQVVAGLHDRVEEGCNEETRGVGTHSRRLFVVNY